MTPCAAPLTFRKVKLLKSNTTDALMQLIGTHAVREASASKERKPVQPSRWCREGEARAEYGVYRSDREGAQGYAMVLGDAGRVVWVQPSLMGQIEKTGHYSVSLADVDGRTLAFPSFNGMPAPEQVWDLVGKGGPSATMNGNVMTIDPKTLR